MEHNNEYQKYRDNADDVLYEYIVHLQRTDSKFRQIHSDFCGYAWHSAMSNKAEDREAYNRQAEEAYCKTVNYLLKKNRYLVRAVLGTDCYVDLFAGLVPYLRDSA